MGYETVVVIDVVTNNSRRDTQKATQDWLRRITFATGGFVVGCF